MGNAKIRRDAFFQSNPNCIFCGGGAPATTVEHCPPRSMFQFKAWPEGFEFPSCATCNHGSSDHDVLVAMLARFDHEEDQGNSDGRLPGLIKNVDAQYPGLIRRMMPSAVEARRLNKEYGVTPRVGETHQEAAPIKLTPEIQEAISVVALKLVKGVYYSAANLIFPAKGCLLLNWFTNVELLNGGSYALFDELEKLAGMAPKLKRNGQFLDSQFSYKFTLSDEGTVLILQAIFGMSFGLVVFGSITPGLLEAYSDKYVGRFSVLQSATLPVNLRGGA